MAKTGKAVRVADDLLERFARNFNIASARDLPPQVQQLIAAGKMDEAVQEMIAAAPQLRTPLAGGSGSGSRPPPSKGALAPAAPEGGDMITSGGVRVRGTGRHRYAGGSSPPPPQEPLGDAIRTILRDRDRNMRAWEVGAGIAGTGLLYELYRRSQEPNEMATEPPPPPPSTTSQPNQKTLELLRNANKRRM